LALTLVVADHGLRILGNALAIVPAICNHFKLALLPSRFSGPFHRLEKLPRASHECVPSALDYDH
jgi:hypothetical protein